jgi:hypothetical protein
MTDYQVAAMLSKRGARTIAELADSQAQDLLAKLHGLIDQARAGETLLPDSGHDPAGFTVLDHGEAEESQEEQVVPESVTEVLDEVTDEISEDAPEEAKDEDAPSTTTGFSNVVNAIATDFGIPEAVDDSGLPMWSGQWPSGQRRPKRSP